jgi:hypothetical protein
MATPPDISDILPSDKTIKKYVMDYNREKQPIFDNYTYENVKKFGGAMDLDFVTKKSHFFGANIHYLTEDW